jgi:hypothetical protein
MSKAPKPVDEPEFTGPAVDQPFFGAEGGIGNTHVHALDPEEALAYAKYLEDKAKFDALPPEPVVPAVPEPEPKGKLNSMGFGDRFAKATREI